VAWRGRGCGIFQRFSRKARSGSEAWYLPGVLASGVVRSEWVRSQRREDHQDLVSGVVGGKPEFARPAAYFPPAEPGVEVFESCSPAGREVELLETHFVPGDLLEPTHQGRPDALVTVSRLGLQVVDSSPVGDEGTGVAAKDYPSCERAAAAGEQYAASPGFEAVGEGIDCRGDVAGVDRGKRESRGAAGIGDRYPARGQFLPGRWIGVARVRELDDVEAVAGRHGPTVSRWGVIASFLAAAYPGGAGGPVSGGGALPGDGAGDVDAEQASQHGCGQVSRELEQCGGAGLAGIDAVLAETMTLTGSASTSGMPAVIAQPPSRVILARRGRSPPTPASSPEAVFGFRNLSRSETRAGPRRARIETRVTGLEAGMRSCDRDPGHVTTGT
jgi:hypothetical protein